MAEAWGGLYFLIVVEKIPEISANIPKHLRNIAKNLQNPENVGKNPAISTKILQISRAVSRHLSELRGLQSAGTQQQWQQQAECADRCMLDRRATRAALLVALGT